VNIRYLSCVGALVLAGCSTTGMSSRSQFACEAPEGVQCMSASGVYYNALNDNLPALRVSRELGAGSQVAANVSVAGLLSKALGGTAPSAADAGKAGAPELVMQGPIPATGYRAPDFAATGAVRAAPRVMRVWVPPWQDSDGDLHDQTYLYLTLDTGRWLVEHTQANAVRPRKLAGSTLLSSDESKLAGEAAGKSAAPGFSAAVEQLSAPKQP